MARFRTTIAAALAGLAAAVAPLAADAQDYPKQTVKFVAPIPPGGSTEVLAREVARGLTERLGQPVIVENRPGGAGSVGTASVAKAPPDGYTMVLVNSSHSINPHVYPKLPFDALKDFVPVVNMVQLPMVVAVNAAVPAKSLQELIALAKAKPGSLSYASSGNGGAGHVTGELFLQQAGLSMVHVPYRGSAPAVTDVVGGQVPVLVADMPVVQPHVKSGALRVLGITSSKRSPAAPDVPTFAESGIRGMELSIWIGVLMPAGTPSEIVQKMNREIVSILKEPEMAAKVTARGFEVVASTPEEFASLIRADYERFGNVVRAAGIKAD